MSTRVRGSPSWSTGTWRSSDDVTQLSPGLHRQAGRRQARGCYRDMHQSGWLLLGRVPGRPLHASPGSDADRGSDQGPRQSDRLGCVHSALQRSADCLGLDHLSESTDPRPGHHPARRQPRHVDQSTLLLQPTARVHRTGFPLWQGAKVGRTATGEEPPASRSRNRRRYRGGDFTLRRKQAQHARFWWHLHRQDRRRPKNSFLCQR